MTPSGPTAPLDWAEVRRRVEAARQAMERGWSASPEETRRILRKRAQALAVETLEAAAGPAPTKWVTFLLADETYGIELSFVREVSMLHALTPLPCTPPFVLGVANVRGQTLSILDLRKFFELPAGEANPQNRLIILQWGEMELALITDAIVGVRAMHPHELRPAPPTLTGVREAYLKGVTTEQLVLLDGERLLSDRKIVVDEHVEP